MRLQIAHTNPDRADDLNGIAELPPGLARKQGENILRTIRRANDDSDNGLLDLTQKPVPVPPDKKQVQQLSGIVRDTAHELDIAPEILATRRDITGILNDRDDVRALQGWRRTIIGDRLLAAR